MIFQALKTIHVVHGAFSVWRNEHAATAIEYALIAAGVALAIVAVVFLVGEDVLGLFEGVESELEAVL